VLEECCHEHDKCCGTCGETQRRCDNAFSKCLLKTCDTHYATHANCRSLAGLMGATVKSMGCKSYSDAQAAACVCVASGEL
jgi:hypothetical protein